MKIFKQNIKKITKNVDYDIGYIEDNDHDGIYVWYLYSIKLHAPFNTFFLPGCSFYLYINYSRNDFTHIHKISHRYILFS